MKKKAKETNYLEKKIGESFVGIFPMKYLECYYFGVRSQFLGLFLPLEII